MKFLKRIMIKKMAQKATQLLVAFLLAHGVDATMDSMGITVDWRQFEVFLSGVLFVALEGLRNWLKVRVGMRFL